MATADGSSGKGKKTVPASPLAAGGSSGKGKKPVPASPLAAGGSSGNGKKPIPASPKWPQTEEEFVNEWFWKGSNGNELVKKLNKSNRGPQIEKDDWNYIRRERDRPTVYCIVLNDDQIIPGTTTEKTKAGESKEVEWKLCKVGFTQVPTASGTNNRMEQLKMEINRKYKEKMPKREAKASVLFVLPIGAVDTKPYFETEKRIRGKVGLPIDKELAKKLCLPCSTEWVLTTQGFLKMIKRKIDELKGTGEPIDLFKGVDFDNPAPYWAVLDAKKTKVVAFTEQ